MADAVVDSQRRLFATKTVCRRYLRNSRGGGRRDAEKEEQGGGRREQGGGGAVQDQEEEEAVHLRHWFLFKAIEFCTPVKRRAKPDRLNRNQCRKAGEAGCRSFRMTWRRWPCCVSDKRGTCPSDR